MGQSAAPKGNRETSQGRQALKEKLSIYAQKSSSGFYNNAKPTHTRQSHFDSSTFSKKGPSDKKEDEEDKCETASNEQ